MSTIETILSRMMSETAFAEAVFTDTEKALTEYHLPAEVISKFKDTSRADFEALASQAPEERKSFASNNLGRMIVGVDNVEIGR